MVELSVQSSSEDENLSEHEAVEVDEFEDSASELGDIHSASDNEQQDGSANDDGEIENNDNKLENDNEGSAIDDNESENDHEGSAIDDNESENDNDNENDDIEEHESSRDKTDCETRDKAADEVKAMIHISLKRAKIYVVRNLIQRIATLKSKKGGEAQIAKNLRKADRMSKVIETLKQFMIATLAQRTMEVFEGTADTTYLDMWKASSDSKKVESLIDTYMNMEVDEKYSHIAYLRMLSCKGVRQKLETIAAAVAQAMEISQNPWKKKRGDDNDGQRIESNEIKKRKEEKLKKIKKRNKEKRKERKKQMIKEIRKEKRKLKNNNNSKNKNSKSKNTKKNAVKHAKKQVLANGDGKDGDNYDRDESKNADVSTVTDPQTASIDNPPLKEAEVEKDNTTTTTTKISHSVGGTSHTKNNKRMKREVQDILNEADLEKDSITTTTTKTSHGDDGTSHTDNNKRMKREIQATTNEADLEKDNAITTKTSHSLGETKLTKINRRIRRQTAEKLSPSKGDTETTIPMDQNAHDVDHTGCDDFFMDGAVATQQQEEDINEPVDQEFCAPVTNEKPVGRSGNFDRKKNRTGQRERKKQKQQQTNSSVNNVRHKHQHSDRRSNSMGRNTRNTQHYRNNDTRLPHSRLPHSRLPHSRLPHKYNDHNRAVNNRNTFKNTEVKKEQKKVDETLHPSWQAKQRMKSQQGLSIFTGTKITFD